MKRILYFFVFAFVLFSCHGAKYYVKEGQRYDSMGDYDNATANFAEAYSIDPDNKDAKKGFKKSGQKLLDQLLTEFKSDFEASRYEDAMAQYKKSEKFYNNVKSRGIELVFAEEYKTLYTQAIERYQQGLYLDASSAVISMDYAKASELAGKLRSANPAYDGLQQLERSIEVDPIYMNGVTAYNKGQKLIAIRYFNQVNSIYPGYRENDTYLTELSKLSKQVVALFPFENRSREMGVDRLIYKAVESKLQEMTSSLFGYLGESLVQTQLITMGKNSQPPFDDATILQAGKNLVANKAVVVTISDVTEEPIANDENFQIAYLREKIINWDPYYGNTTSYQWRETKYKEIDEGVKYGLLVQVKIYEPVSGAIIYNDIVTKSIVSRVKYARYDGDYMDLYPTMGYISNTELSKWRGRFTAGSDKKSKTELLDLLIKAAGNDISDIIFSKLN